MEKVNEQQDVSENQKILLQQALDMLEEQALHIEAPMLPTGEELLNRIRAAISQQAEPCEPATAKDEREAVVVVGWLGGNGLHSEENEATGAPFPLMTVAQHERIVAALSAQLSAPERVSVPVVLLERVTTWRDGDEGDSGRSELRALLASHAKTGKANP